MPRNASIHLFGKVVTEPKSSTSKNGKPVLSMLVSVQTTKKQPNSQYYETDLYKVTAWETLAEQTAGHVQKGGTVIVDGSFMIGTDWTDQSGKTHPSLEVTAYNITQVLRPYRNNSNNNNNSDEDLF